MFLHAVMGCLRSFDPDTDELVRIAVRVSREMKVARRYVLDENRNREDGLDKAQSTPCGNQFVAW